MADNENLNPAEEPGTGEETGTGAETGNGEGTGTGENTGTEKTGTGAESGSGTDAGTETGTALTLLEKAKNAIGVTDTEYDDEITDLIAAAKQDLHISGNTQKDAEEDPLIRRAIITYVKANFGAPENYQQLLASYEMQKAQMMYATGYTTWGDEEPEEPEDDETENGDSDH